jgi:hypothetical protein
MIIIAIALRLSFENLVCSKGTKLNSSSIAFSFIPLPFLEEKGFLKLLDGT